MKTYKKAYMYLFIGIGAACIFCSIYGTRVLNPVYTDWLLETGGDLSQHYLGWKAYRYSSWHFPVGLADTLAYPGTSSIIFTDSIPIFAFLFKLLSPILPESFQYFGLWGILCFVLQGILSARIISYFTDKRAFVVLSSLLLVYTPVMIGRMYGHTALAGHWILLLGLDVLFARERYRRNRDMYGIVCIMGALSASIHLYFVLMNGIILVGICLAELLRYRDTKKSFILLGIYLVSAAAAVGFWGGFGSGFSAGAGGLGYFSLNINAFVNPQGWSCIFRDLPLYGGGQYEGFAYLGAGCILMVVFAAITSLGNMNLKAINRAGIQGGYKALRCIDCISGCAVSCCYSQ